MQPWVSVVVTGENMGVTANTGRMLYFWCTE